jgi:hypothetical protein
LEQEIDQMEKSIEKAKRAKNKILSQEGTVQKL